MYSKGVFESSKLIESIYIVGIQEIKEESN